MSDTVKLIIEIPKVMYECIQNKTYCGSLYEYLGKGIPLDDVKAEIEHMACRQYEHRLTLDRQEVIEILDNIGKTESEDKE